MLQSAGGVVDSSPSQGLSTWPDLKLVVSLCSTMTMLGVRGGGHYPHSAPGGVRVRAPVVHA